MKWYKHWMVRISVKLANGIAGKLLAALNNEGSDRGAGGAKTKGKPTHPHNSEKAGIEEEDDEYAGPSSLQYRRHVRWTREIVCTVPSRSLGAV